MIIAVIQGKCQSVERCLMPILWSEVFQVFSSEIQEVKKVMEDFLCQGVEGNRVVGVDTYLVYFSIKDDFLE
jgi:hypothetical protein